MHFEVLTEDKSGGIVVETLIRKMAQSRFSDFTLSLRPHRGKGDLPENPYAKPGRYASGLLDLLPAKLRAYDRVYAGSDFTLVVIMDSDNLPFAEIHDMLAVHALRYAPGLSHVIGVCVEETESWLLADRKAILAAYPDADRRVLSAYEQDSVCGTWEVLCHAILRERAPSLIRVGYPAIGQYKYEWAEKISPYLDPASNLSPSFLAFAREFTAVMRYAERKNA